MKLKGFLLLLLFFLLTGCTTLNQESYDTILDYSIHSNANIYNVFRAGYKYYLPRGVKIIDYEGSNEILSSGDYLYYMYVDRVSYYHHKTDEYQPKEDVFYSKALSDGDKFGYIEIKNTENEKYFVEIMYNYAKIEVIVEKDRINKTLAFAASILSSVTYQDEVLMSLMGEDVLKTNEVEHNIFESADTESGYLEIIEEYGQYEEKDEVVDPDFITR